MGTLGFSYFAISALTVVFPFSSSVFFYKRGDLPPQPFFFPHEIGGGDVGIFRFHMHRPSIASSFSFSFWLFFFFLPISTGHNTVVPFS